MVLCPGSLLSEKSFVRVVLCPSTDIFQLVVQGMGNVQIIIEGVVEDNYIFSNGDKIAK